MVKTEIDNENGREPGAQLDEDVGTWSVKYL